MFYLVGKERMPTFVPYVISERKPNVLPKKKRWFKIVAIGVVSKSNPAFLFVTLIG